MLFRYRQLLSDHGSIIGLGFFLAFFSGFGQSFFISLFVPGFKDELQIDNRTFGFLYAAVTLLSGFVLPVFGAKFERENTSKFTLVVIVSMLCAVFLLAAAESLLVLGFAIFGLRLCGQGLFSHISATLVGKAIKSGRGAALSITSLGYPISEAILPLLGVLFLNVFGWRGAWIGFGLMTGLLLLPYVFFLSIRDTRKLETSDDILVGIVESKEQGTKESTYYFQPRFWFWSAGCLFPPTILTALFIYHAELASQKGWTLELVASSFVAFAVGRFIFSLVGGVLIDRFTATRLYPLFLIPFVIGVLSIAFGNNYWSLIVYLLLTGVTVGIGGPLKTSLLAEIFGEKMLSTVRSQFMSLSIIGTAIGPAIMGYFLDAGWQIATVLKFVGAIMLVFIFLVEVTKFRTFGPDHVR